MSVTMDTMGRPVDLSELKADRWMCPHHPGDETQVVIHTMGVCPRCTRNFEMALRDLRCPLHDAKSTAIATDGGTSYRCEAALYPHVWTPVED